MVGIGSRKLIHGRKLNSFDNNQDSISCPNPCKCRWHHTSPPSLIFLDHPLTHQVAGGTVFPGCTQYEELTTDQVVYKWISDPSVTEGDSRAAQCPHLIDPKDTGQVPSFFISRELHCRVVGTYLDLHDSRSRSHCVRSR